jgi:NAD-dependent deacetylase
MTRQSQEIIRIISDVACLIRNSHRTVSLTGAGISTPSGIPDFRSPNVGLWERFEPMEVASLTTFRHNPEQFYRWLHPLAIQMHSARPNPAHLAMARLQSAGYISVIITQNIDGLHRQAGSQNVLEVHGTLDSMTCTNCYRQYPAADYIEDYINHCTIPLCPACSSILKPDIILYDEQLPVRTWQKAEAASKQCDLMLVIGTSLEVMPSARLPLVALEHGAHLVIINNSETFMDERAEAVIHGDVADVLPRITAEVLNA